MQKSVPTSIDADTLPTNEQNNKVSSTEEQEHDIVFAEEQTHLNEVYATLRELENTLTQKLQRGGIDAAADKEAMTEDIAPNFGSWGEALETYVDYATVNSVIEDYNTAQASAAEKLEKVRLLLEQPYFAKICVQFSPEQTPRELYIGATGMTDERYKRLVVDWRSPVAEVYYNQDEGGTSYVANGRTIDVELKLRRQFNIARDKLFAYFDTTIAIQDSLLLKSLSEHKSSKMRAITATIQREQNRVIRHDDVPVLLVSGVAGSGKTSVLLQRIAYLFYRHRKNLNPRNVCIITPNPTLKSYIDNVLPDMGEKNPAILTWSEFISTLLPKESGTGNLDVALSVFNEIEQASAPGTLKFTTSDFRDITINGTRLISAAQVRACREKYAHVEAGVHLVTLMREDLKTRLDSRLASMAAHEEILDEITALPLSEQLAIFGENIELENEEQLKGRALSFLQMRYKDAYVALERDEWLSIGSIARRIVSPEGLCPLALIYLKMACTGMDSPDTKYVMIDEVQDYTPAQLAVIARYFRRAHFMLLGDENQAIRSNGASFMQTRTIFESIRGPVSECHLKTSYRSTPAITALFSSLLPQEERGTITSVQRESTPVHMQACPNAADYENALRAAFSEARKNDGLTAVIVPWKNEMRRLVRLLGNDAPAVLKDGEALPASGMILLTLANAKGLEFDNVIIPDASESLFPTNDRIAKNRLYTTISRATQTVTILANGTLTPLLTSPSSP